MGGGHNTTVKKGEKIVKPIDPQKEGYTFEGWFKEADCIHEWRFDFDIVIEDTNLYAKWQEKALKLITTYNDEANSVYLKPIWRTKEIYDESVLFVGEKSSANLLYVPSGKVTVRNYQLNKTYVEGKDYVIAGNKITRLAGGELPFFDVNEYFLLEPSKVKIGVDLSNCEFDFSEKRYLYHSEGTGITKNHIMVSYRTEEDWKGSIPAFQTDKFTHFIHQIQTTSPTIMFYGDSITVGCNASGTGHGGMINPYLPSWPKLIVNWLSHKYSTNVTLLNESTGGWKTKDGKSNFSNLILPKAKEIDLLVIAFGMNDGSTPRDLYRKDITDMVDDFLALNPTGSILLVSPMNPNTQSDWFGNQQYFEEELLQIASTRQNVGVAQVNTLFTQMERLGKRTRDWLANNINHPNDFGVRLYAQVILSTVIGKDLEE